MTKKGKKKQFRAQSLKRLQNASGFGSYQKDKKVLTALYKYIVESNVVNVMLYLPLKTEVNLYPLIQKLRKEKKVLYVPFMEESTLCTIYGRCKF